MSHHALIAKIFGISCLGASNENSPYPWHVGATGRSPLRKFAAIAQLIGQDPWDRTHLAHMWGRGIAPVPTSYFPEPFRLGPVPHTGLLPRAIKLHRQNTSLDQRVASWDGAMPRPHM